MQNSNGPVLPDFHRDPNYTFAKSLGASVIDQFGQVIHSTGWCDAWGCSFKAELVALHCAVVAIGGTLTVSVDCKSLRNAFDEIRLLGSVPDNVAYKDLWVKTFQLCGFQEHCRISIRWIKAHQIDHNRGGGSQDQILNQVADVEARRQADLNSPVPKNFYESVKWHLNLKRMWLCELSLLVSSTKEENSDDVGQSCDREDGLPESSQGKAVVELFPKWDWNKPIAIYNWSMSQQNHEPPKIWTFSCELWKTSVQFFKELRWRVSDDTGLSVYELSYIFYRRFRICPPEINKGTAGNFLVLPGWLRHCLRIFRKCGIRVAPQGIEFEPRKALFAGAYFPYGCWKGARFFVEAGELTSLANFILSLPGASSWNRPLNAVP